MKKLLSFLFVMSLLTTNTVLLTSCNLGFKNSKFSESINDFTVDFDKIKSKLTSKPIDGSTLDELLPFGSKNNNAKILKLINDIINNKHVKVKILNSPKTNLSQTNNSVKIEISNTSSSTKQFEVKFKNVKPYTDWQINILFAAIKNKFIRPIDCGFISEYSRIASKITLLESKICERVNDERIRFELLDTYKTFRQVKNKIKIKIFVNHRYFYFKEETLSLKIIKQNSHSSGYSDSSKPKHDQPDDKKTNDDQKSNKSESEKKIDEISKLSYCQLIGKESNQVNDSTSHYRSIMGYLHSDKNGRFFKCLYDRVHKKEVNESFTKVYNALSYRVFQILKKELKEVENLFETLNVFENKIWEKNSVVNKLSEYLKEVVKFINSKK